MTTPLRRALQTAPRLTGPALFVGALTAALTLPMVHAPQPSTAQDSTYEQMRARFEGTWRVTLAPAAARARVNTAIDQAVGAMNYFVRGIARGQLQENTPINRTVVLGFPGDDRVRVRFEDTGWEATTRLGRTVRTRSADGTAIRLTQRFRGETLEQVFEADQGTRWNVYTGTGDGQMRINATTSGTMMPQPLRFNFDYRRR